jgi:pimeloyl-ACP methyl ester carboxylesterase
MRRSTMWIGSVAIVAILLVVTVVVVQGPSDWLPFGAGGGAGNGTVNESSTTQSYTSSVDGASLSYYEWLPIGFNASQSYPFLLFLHGKGHGGDQVFTEAGGVSAINAAIQDGFIVGSLNTRTNGGFYIDSQYTGPQEQDVLDALQHEQQLRHVSTLWLFGESMGTMGAYSIAEHHPGLLAGIGVIATCPDLYEIQAYKIAVGRSSDLNFWLGVTGGSLANQSSYADGLTYYESAFRFFPQNLSGTRLYVVQGGDDVDCPNNPNIWPFQQANDTILDSTCNVATTMDEPADCTTPFATLESEHPGQYHYRYVYEATAPHTLDDLDGPDMIHYFLGQSSYGLYTAGIGGTPVPSS